MIYIRRPGMLMWRDFLHRDQIVSGSKGMEHAYCLVDIEDTAHSYPVAGGTGSASCTSRIVCAGEIQGVCEVG